jgi:hypothetical protein
MNAYFGFPANRPSNCDAVAAMSLTQFFSTIDGSYIPAVVEDVEEWVAIADARGLDFAVYEGGHHFRQNTGCGQSNQDKISDLFDRAVDDARMKTSYLTFLEGMVDAGTVLFAHYHSTGLYRSNNRFGSRQHLLQERVDAPRYDALMTFAETNGEMPPPLPPPGSVVVYDPAGGDVFVVDVNAAGDRFTNPTVSGTVSGADTVGTAYLGGPEATVDDVVFYSSVTGRFQFASITAADETTGHRDLDVFADVTGTRGWSHVITGDYNGDGTGDVLFYRASDGLMRFYTTNASGAFIPLTPAYFGTRGWTHLVAGDYNGDGSDDVLWYRARDGLMRFYEVTDSGEFRALTPAYFGTRSWTAIPAGDYDGDGTDDVMFYRGDGIARFYEVDATGTFKALGVAFHPSSGYTQIESVEFTPDTPGVDLVWYRPGSDLLVATRYNVNGVISLWNPQSTSVYGDDLIIATAVTR